LRLHRFVDTWHSAAILSRIAILTAAPELPLYRVQEFRIHKKR